MTKSKIEGEKRLINAKSQSDKMVLYARDIVEKDFLTLDASTSVFHAAKVMNEKRHGFVVVSIPSNDREGIVTEWDILSKVVAMGKDPEDVTLGEIMTKGLVTVRSDAGISTVAEIMAGRGVRRVLVTQGDEVIGVITSKTVLSRLKDYVDNVSSQISRLQAPWF